MKRFYLVVLLLSLALSAHGTGLLKEAQGLWAIDGDTIRVEFEGERPEARYVSVNAPELDDCLGIEIEGDLHHIQIQGLGWPLAPRAT